MRIVHIANFYGPNSGGIKTTLHEFGRRYKELGYEFIYIVPGSHGFREETQYGLKISLPGRLLPGTGGYMIIKSNKEVRNVLKELKPDRLEVSDRFTMFGVGRWATDMGISTVAFSHETLSGLARKFLPIGNWLRTHLVNWHNRKLARTFDQIITTTEFAAREFKEINTTNLVRVPLGVDLENFHPNNRSEEFRKELLKGNKVLLVHCGRLSPEKQPRRSIETLIELRRRGVDARLVVVGAGPMWKKMMNQAKGHPVDMLGYVVDRKRVSKILAAADVSLAPGPLETFCLAALESLASGTPVVASASSAVGEFLGLRSKYPAGAIARDDAESFACAAINLMDSKLIRLAAREMAESMSWEQSISMMQQVHNVA